MTISILWLDDDFRAAFSGVLPIFHLPFASHHIFPFIVTWAAVCSHSIFISHLNMEEI